MKIARLLMLLALCPVFVVACSSGDDDGGQAITQRPANFKGMEGSAAGGSAGGQAAQSDRPGTAPPPGP